ncbi:MAG: recombinase family protein [Lacipirellulaceae bacterium]
MICRVSSPGEGKQREESNDDQEVRLRDYLEQQWDGPTMIEVIAGVGSGEDVQREELYKAELAVETGEYDLILCEDLSRISRRYHAQRFCELAEDFDTRLIAVNGDVDTGQPNWRMLAGFSAIRHEMYNADSSQRIQRSQQNIFDNGGMCQHLIYGYIKEPGSKTDDGVRKDPAAEPIYREWFRMLQQGASFAEVADWLNEMGVPTGPLCRNKKWDGAMVARITRNPILKGVRERNRKMSKRINKTGKYRSVNAPAEMLRTRECPHLAFVDAELFDEVNALLNERTAIYSTAKKNSIAPRKGIPKKRTVWPAQHIRCGVCGRTMICQGNSEKRSIMCSGAANYLCWNSVTLNLEKTGRKLAEAVCEELVRMPDYDSTLEAMVAEEADHVLSGRNQRQQEIKVEIGTIDRKLENLSEAVAQSGGSATLLQNLRQHEVQKAALERELKQLRKLPEPKLVLPSIAELRERATTALNDLRAESPEFARLMTQLLPSIAVFPYSLLDSNKIVLRASVSLDLGAVVPGAEDYQSIKHRYSKQLLVDLFPLPQPERYRQEIWELSNCGLGLTEREIAGRLGITQPVVQRAKRLQRRMMAEDLADAYYPVLEPPMARNKLRRHHHKRYHFEPLPGFPLDWPSS